MSEQSGWVPTRSGAVFAALHHPMGEPTGTAVVLVPPFGWEAMSSARQVRAWARALAHAGHAAVRFHLPGQGDSEGDAALQDLRTWSESLTDLVLQTRVTTDCSRVCVVGLGMGGLVALQAVHDGCDVDDLVLWACSGSGRRVLRELRAFASLSTPGEATTPASLTDAGDGTLWAHGYPLGSRAQEQIAEFDAAALSLSRVQRALVLGRGTLPHDARLIQLLAAQSVVTAEPGPGYDEMTVEPRLSTSPVETIGRVNDWLRESDARPTPEPERRARPQRAAATTGASGAWPEAAFAERLVRVGPVSAVITPATDAVLTAVFLSAGAIPCSGPNRMWTDTARRWSAVGVSSVRVDLTGIGEADGPEAGTSGPQGFYLDTYRQQVTDVLDTVEHWGLPRQVLLIGLCSGGYWAAQQALRDERVVAVAALNTPSLVWPPPLASLGARRRLRELTIWQTWAPMFTDRAARVEAVGKVRGSLRLVRGRLRPGRTNAPLSDSPTTSVQVLKLLEQRQVPVFLGLSPGEELLPAVTTLPPGNGTVIRHLTGPSGAHTLAPVVLARQGVEVLELALRAARSADERSKRRDVQA